MHATSFLIYDSTTLFLSVCSKHCIILECSEADFVFVEPFYSSQSCLGVTGVVSAEEEDHAVAEGPTVVAAAGKSSFRSKG